jgi:hypothetical protein
MGILNVNALGGDGIYTTIGAALTAAAASGDTIEIANGTYTETLTINKSVTLKGTSKANTIITSAGSTITITANGVTLQDLTVNTSATTGAIRVITILGNIENTTFNNLKITSTSRGANGGNIGLYLDNNDSVYSNGRIITNVNIINCDFTTSWIGIRTAQYARTTGVTLSGCTFTNHGAAGIHSDTVAPNVAIPNTSMEVGNVNWDISGCTFTNIGVINENYPGPIFLEKFGNSSIKNCTFSGWDSVPFNNFNYAFIQINIKRASSSRGGFDTFNGKNITITGNTFLGYPVAGTTTTATRVVGLWVQGRNEGTTNSLNPGLIENAVITNNTFTDIGSAMRISGNIFEDTMTIDGNRFENPTPATGATFRRTDISVSGSTFTLLNHGYAANDEVRFGANSMPSGLDSNQLYYVTGTPTITTFQVSLTLGGAVVSTSSAGTNLFVDGPSINFPSLRKTGIKVTSPNTLTLTSHGLKIGAAVVFGPETSQVSITNVDTTTETFTTSGNHGFVTGDAVRLSATAMPSPLVTTTTYFIIRMSDNTFRLATTSANATATTPTAINISGTGTNIFVQNMAPGIIAGTTYYVMTIPTANTFTLGTTHGANNPGVTGAVTTSLNTKLSMYLDMGHGVSSSDVIQIVGGTTAPGIPTGTYYIRSVPNQFVFKISSIIGGTALTPTSISTASSFSFTNNRYIDLTWTDPKSSMPLSSTTTFFPGSNTISLTTHGYSNGDAIFFKTSSALPTGLTATTSYAFNPTLYYVIGATTNTFQVAATPNGSAVSFTGVGVGTHYIYKIFKVDAKQCYFDIISPSVYIGDNTITDAQRYSLISSFALSDNRVIMTTSSSPIVPITALFNVPMDQPLVIAGDVATYDNSASEIVASRSADLSALTGMIVDNLPTNSFKVVAGVSKIVSEDLNFTIKVFDSAGNPITTFDEPIVIRIRSLYPYTLKTANVLLNGVTFVAVATYDPETGYWTFELDENSEYSLDATAPCLVEGTKVLTASGYVNVEDLKAGTRIVTGDNRSVEVVKVHSTKYNRTTYITAPYIIEKDAFGVNYPQQQIKISGRHAIQLKSGLWEVPSEAARSNNGKVRQVPIGSSVHYYHVELPDYEKDTLVADGLIVESYNNGNYDESYTWNAKQNGYERKVVRKF